MISDFKLKADELRRAYDLETMNFESTEDLDPLKGIIPGFPEHITMKGSQLPWIHRSAFVC